MEDIVKGIQMTVFPNRIAFRVIAEGLFKVTCFHYYCWRHPLSQFLLFTCKFYKKGQKRWNTLKMKFQEIEV